MMRSSEKDTKLAQKLGQLEPFIAVFPQECMGQLAYFGQPNTFLAANLIRTPQELFLGPKKYLLL